MKPLHLVAACVLAAAVAGCSRPSPVAPPEAATTHRDEHTGWLGTPTPVTVPAARDARFPHFATSKSGKTLVLSWLEPVGAEGTFALRYAQWLGQGRWGEPVEVASGKDWFVNWADFPSVMPADEGPWAAHWLQQKPGGVYSYDVMVRLSADSGRTWSESRSPHTDGTATEHGFVSLTQTAAGPYAIWLDGRETAGEGHAHGADQHGSSGGAMTLRGAALQAKGAVDEGTEIDDRVCDCCQTDVATTAEGLVVVYRDRSADETRDILAARLVAGQWSTPVVVHADGWRINACPVNGPAIDARGQNVVVAWFTAPDQSRVRIAFSRDSGRTFAAPIEVAEGKVVGRVDVVLLDDDRAVVSWLAEGARGAAIRAQPFTQTGPAGPAVDIADADVARSSGFPQMAKIEGGLLFAWTATGSPALVRAVFAPLR